MLQTLSITNYVIIDRAEIRFTPGLNMITGETGAGKSLLLGAMGLILGRRADTQVLFDPESKAVIEAVFYDSENMAAGAIQSYDLDEGQQIVLRREISPNGRSRAFVNDTPVTLEMMSDISGMLMDIHQQFETLEIQQSSEQYNVLDAYCGNQSKRATYQKEFEHFNHLTTRLASLKDQNANAIKEKDYLNFQLNEFDGLQIETGGVAAMEEELQLQSGAEEIKAVLVEITDGLAGDQSLTDQLRHQARTLTRLAQKNSHLEGFVQKLEGLLDECQELSKEISQFQEQLDPDPARKTQLEQKLDAINRVMLKHGAKNEQELQGMRQQLMAQLDRWTHLEDEIALCEKMRIETQRSLEGQATAISSARKTGAPKLAKYVSNGLHDLAMKNAELLIKVVDADELNFYGKDTVEFLFAPNLGSDAKPIKKIASGGELSRLNLCLKSAVSDQMQLPTLVFDEIDAGVSGEVAIRMGHKLKMVATKHQVVMITHSPQIAAQAGNHLQVSKTDLGGRTIARVRTLPPKERITEIAKMLSGDPPTNAAILNAKTLIES